jgi:hypothetical protein
MLLGFKLSPCTVQSLKGLRWLKALFPTAGNFEHKNTKHNPEKKNRKRNKRNMIIMKIQERENKLLGSKRREHNWKMPLTEMSTRNIFWG